MPDFRTSIGAGVRSFPQVQNSSGQFLVFANFFKRLGANFDVGVQGVYEQAAGDMRHLLPESAFRINIGFVYGIDQVFNSQFGDTDSILNLEHGYIR